MMLTCYNALEGRVNVAASCEDVVSLTRDQILEIIEREARKRLGLSARELFRRYARYTLDDPGAVSDLVIL